MVDKVRDNKAYIAKAPSTGAPTLVTFGPGGEPVHTEVGGSSAPIAISVSRDLTAADDGARYYATGPITLTTPNGLVPKPECSVLPPPTGNLTVAFSGGATGNGAATAITRTRAANPAGIVITPYPDVTDGYGVSGA